MEGMGKMFYKSMFSVIVIVGIGIGSLFRFVVYYVFVVRSL